MTTFAAILTLGVRAALVLALLLIVLAAIAAIPDLIAAIARLWRDQEDR